ncbi:MAG: GC-type dockerin domain-anchored protein [Phycisphaerales bacterium]|jgi:hypothetical protein
MIHDHASGGARTALARQLAATALVVLLMAMPGKGQPCDPQWAEGVFGLVGVNRDVHAMTTWDDGRGEALYICGNFETVGSVESSNIARWDGQAWAPLDSGTNLFTYAMVAFDDGTGEKLCAGGNFYRAGGVDVDNIARWDGARWGPVGAGFFGSVHSLAIYDDGSGPILYAGGNLNRSTGGAHSLKGIARWDGAAWNPVGVGLGLYFVEVRALVVFDDGNGPALYAAGDFGILGDRRIANHIAKWDGVAWQPLEGSGGIGLDDTAFALAVYDDGAGEALYVGGRFQHAGGVPARGVARWDGSEWSGLADGFDGVALDMQVYDDGSGPALFVGGRLASSGEPVESVAKWDGRRWTGLDAAMDERVDAMAVYDDGTGERLFVGGRFKTVADAFMGGLATWDGAAWASIASPGDGAGMDREVRVLATHDDGGGEALYAGGFFEYAGGVRANHVARWDGLRWSALGQGLDAGALALASFDDGSGPALYAGGYFSTAGSQPARGVARWDGAAWSTVGTGEGCDGLVNALAVFDDGSGPALYAGGDFLRVDGQTAKYVARWDGRTWKAVGSGARAEVFCLHVFDDGKGPALYAGSDDFTLPGVPNNCVLKWDGRVWSDLSTPLNGEAFDMATYDDGRGPALYIVGRLGVIGRPETSGAVRWDGARYEPLGGGLSNIAYAVDVFDPGGGNGPDLVVGGAFSSMYGGPGNYLARWDGRTWWPLGSGMDGSTPRVYALHAHDDGSGAALFAGGRFTSAGGHASSRIARYGCVRRPCRADVDGDGELTVMDLLAFQSFFDAGDPRADFDGDGELSLFDFLAFQNAFAAGCP